MSSFRPFFWLLACAPIATSAAAPERIQLPLSFEQNQGQAASATQYLARGNGYAVTLQQSGFALSVTQARGLSTTSVRFSGASSGAKLTALDPLQGTVNYFIGSTPSKWRRDIPTFGKIEYANIYPGIDVIYYGQQGSVEYDFRVQPKADPSKIRLNITGAARPRIDAATGDLLIGDMRQHKPVAYQIAGNDRVAVDCDYILLGTNAAFRLGKYDAALPLIIDPVLTYATYLGGSSGDSIWKMKVDGAGNLYMAGSTTSTNFPAAGGAQLGYGGSGGQLLQVQFGDAFVAKLNPAGTALLYTTYIGGSGDDLAASIAIDSAGNAYVAGATQSNNFPVSANAPQKSAKGSGQDDNGFYNPGDGFVLKLNAAGNQLVYSTYLGGALNDFAASVAVTSGGSAVVVGGTNSTDFPTTSGAISSQFRGSANFGPSVAGDAFITMMSPTGGAFSYSTFLGGRSRDGATSVALDAQDNVYVTGFTFSGDFPVTAGAYQTSLKGLETSTDYFGAAGDAFVAKVSSQGSLAFASYLGGSFREYASGIAVGADNSVYVTGVTSSNNFPATANAPQKTYGGDRTYGNVGDYYYGDAFVAKLNAQGSALVYASYLGGKGDEAGMDIAVDPAGNAYLSGFTTSPEFPVTADALQKTNAGLGGQGFASNAAQGFPEERVRNTGDAFFTKLAADGTLSYSSFYGGNRDDAARAIAVDAAGNAYVGGSTLSPTLAGTAGSVQATFGGAGIQYPRGDAFVAKFGFGGTLPGLPSRVNVVSGFTSTGTAGAGLPSPFTVEVTDAQGAAISGVTVAFSATNASVNPASAVTNAQGRASTTVTLGTAGSGSVTATVANIAPVSVTLTTNPASSNVITSVNTAWGAPEIGQNTFIEIKGNNLVPATTPANGVIWSDAPEFQQSRMPTQLSGVSVTVNGKPAYVYFFCSKVTSACATDQINVLTPLDNATGPVNVVVTSGAGTTPVFSVQMKPVVPTFLLFNPQGYAVATHANYSLLGPTSLFPGASTPATVNETIVTYAIGFGLPTTPLTEGSSSQSGTFSEAPICKVNDASAAAALYLISPGLYQINITIPAGAKNDDNSLSCTFKGATTPSGTLVTVSKP